MRSNRHFSTVKSLYLLSVFCFFIVSLALAFSANAQCLNGTTGLITIPTARMQDDGDLSFGTAYFDKKYQDYSKRNYDVASFYTSITFLPFLEISLRINRMLNYPGHTYTVDRVPMVRLRLLKEKNLMPAVVFGMHDFVAAFGGETAKHFNATYIVLSKKVNVFDFHAGYSSTIIKADDYQLNGLFYGLACSPVKFLNLFAEYDSRYYNTSVQFKFLKHIAITLAALNFDSYAAGINFKIHL